MTRTRENLLLSLSSYWGYFFFILYQTCSKVKTTFAYIQQMWASEIYLACLIYIPNIGTRRFPTVPDTRNEVVRNYLINIKLFCLQADWFARCYVELTVLLNIMLLRFVLMHFEHWQIILPLITRHQCKTCPMHVNNVSVLLFHRLMSSCFVSSVLSFLWITVLTFKFQGAGALH